MNYDSVALSYTTGCKLAIFYYFKRVLYIFQNTVSCLLKV